MCRSLRSPAHATLGTATCVIVPADMEGIAERFRGCGDGGIKCGGSSGVPFKFNWKSTTKLPAADIDHVTSLALRRHEASKTLRNKRLEIIAVALNINLLLWHSPREYFLVLEVSCLTGYECVGGDPLFRTLAHFVITDHVDAQYDDRGTEVLWPSTGCPRRICYSVTCVGKPLRRRHFPICPGC